MKTINRLFALLLLVLAVAGCNGGNTKKALSHEEKMAPATRSESMGWILVHLEGPPEVIGYQHGFLLAREIIELRGAMAVRNEKMTKRNWDFYRDEAYRLFWRKMPAEYQAEITAIAEGVNAKLGEGSIDVKDMMAINSFLEMADYYVPWLEGQEAPKPAERCSAIAATGSWTTDGKIVMAHNNWSEYLIGARWNVIAEIVPEKGHRIVMDALPGFIHSGDDFNINSAGLIVTETTISDYKGFDTTGTAEFVRARQAIQYASSIDEWVAIMKDRNNGGYANDWLIGDNKTGEIARLELGLKNQFLEKTKDGYFVGSNFPVHEKLKKEETTWDSLSPINSSYYRRLRWDVIMKENKGKIDIEAVKAFMGDHYDMKRNAENPGRYSLCGHLDRDEMGTDEFSWSGAFFAAGAVQSKATDGSLAANMQMWAIMGHPCGMAFDAEGFLAAHPENEFQRGYLIDMPSRQWMLTDVPPGK
ncbi:MAG: phospholipase B family protein [Bacteroidales bacterium]|jgi:hypothetical protein|nr:phospholipase B family protein [Bacteroidales bacterium]